MESGEIFTNIRVSRLIPISEGGLENTRVTERGNMITDDINDIITLCVTR